MQVESLGGYKKLLSFFLIYGKSSFKICWVDSRLSIVDWKRLNFNLSNLLIQFNVLNDRSDCPGYSFRDVTLYLFSCMILYLILYESPLPPLLLHYFNNSKILFIFLNDWLHTTYSQDTPNRDFFFIKCLTWKLVMSLFFKGKISPVHDIVSCHNLLYCMW